MTNKLPKEEDSDSDWDSMSEAHPPPKSDEVNRKHDSKEKPLAAPRIRKELVSIDQNHVRNSSEEDPPHSFKSEVEGHSPINDGKFVPPEKHKKGKLYEPSTATQKTVTFADQMMNDQQGADSEDNSESEDPLYATVKRRKREPLPPLKQSTLAKGQNRSKKKNSKIEIPKQQNTAKNSSLAHQVSKGLDNEGFDYEDELHYSSPISNGPNLLNSFSNPQHETGETENLKSGNDFNEKDPSVQVAISTEDLASNIFAKESLKSINHYLEKGFSLIGLPVACFFLFFHHFLRFFLMSFVKPVFLDTLTIASVYFLHPLFRGVVSPILLSIKLAAVSVAEILTSVLRPLATVIKAFRLVEINYQNERQIEKV